MLLARLSLSSSRTPSPLPCAICHVSSLLNFRRALFPCPSMLWSLTGCPGFLSCPLISCVFSPSFFLGTFVSSGLLSCAGIHVCVHVYVCVCTCLHTCKLTHICVWVRVFVNGLVRGCVHDAMAWMLMWVLSCMLSQSVERRISSFQSAPRTRSPVIEGPL